MNTKTDSQPSDPIEASKAASGDCVSRLVRDYFTEDGAPKKCPKCESKKITEKILAVVDVLYGRGPTCEAEYICECGEDVGFWAYGSWHQSYRNNFVANV